MHQTKTNSSNSFILGIFIAIGLIGLGVLLSKGIIEFKKMDRSVSAKGLAEKEVRANIAIWPIKFSVVSNDLDHLYATIPQKTELVREFLKENGFSDDEISTSIPAIVDKQSQGRFNSSIDKFRHSASTTVTVYSEKVELVLSTMDKLLELGKSGVAISGRSRVEFIYTKLNDIKPDMIAEATKNARVVAEKFAKDSDSKLGKIRLARQGQFSIRNRDSNTPHIKKVRVVTSLVYYLSD